MKIKCENCKTEFEVDEKLVTEDYIQCPFCMSISKNPIKEE